jgi:hypothetical protein
MRALQLVTLLSVASCDVVLGLHEPTLNNSDSGFPQDGSSGDGANNKVPVLLAGNQSGPYMIAEYGPNVFWTNLSGSTVGTANKLDGSAGIFAGQGIADSPIGIAADDAGVYVANSGFSGTVLNCSGAGCSAQSVIYDGGFFNTDLKINGGFVYFLQSNGDEVDRIPFAGGAVQSLATTDTNNSDSYIARIATDGTYVYWSEPFNDRILRKTITGATQQTVFTGTSGSRPSALLFDSGTLFFTTAGNGNGQGTVAYSAPDGTGMQTLAASQHYPFALASDATYVYWTAEGDFDSSNVTQGGGGVFRCAKTGCNTNPDQLVSNLKDARGIAVDDVAIYYVTYETDNGDGKVWRLAK